jgi:diaminopimelate decarboxylase
MMLAIADMAMIVGICRLLYHLWFGAFFSICNPNSSFIPFNNCHNYFVGEICAHFDLFLMTVTLPFSIAQNY